MSIKSSSVKNLGKASSTIRSRDLKDSEIGHGKEVGGFSSN